MALENSQNISQNTNGLPSAVHSKGVPSKTQFAVFVKPWKNLSLPQLAVHVQQLGFNLIELPIRPGFQVEPARIEQDLSGAVKMLADLGIAIGNVTVDLPLTDERLYAACAANNITMNRVMFKRSSPSYWESEAAVRRQLEVALPLCEQYGVKIGVQHHYGGSVPLNSMGLYNLLKDYDPRWVGAIWDPAHNALQGEDALTGLELVQSHLCMVNLKNAYWRRTNPPDGSEAQWRAYFCAGLHGRTSWADVAKGVKRAGYSGPLTFSAEYTDDTYTDRLLEADLAYARKLFDGE
jgi:sugar phosphate isomerase/epimerase